MRARRKAKGRKLLEQCRAAGRRGLVAALASEIATLEAMVLDPHLEGLVWPVDVDQASMVLGRVARRPDYTPREAD